MPDCANESLGKLWGPPSPEASCNLDTGNSSLSFSPPSSVSPISMSPPRRLVKRQSSGYLSESSSSPPPERNERSGFGWYAVFFIHFIPNLIWTVCYLIWNQLILFGPTLWLSCWLWVFWKCFHIPLNIVKWLLTVFTIPATERYRKKRTVLISGGSTIQAIHLARNFHSVGARVVVFEVSGFFNLAKFSTAVDKFYTVPCPVGDNVTKYVAAIKRIVEEEKVVYYIPVSVTTTAFYDALVKPHVELLGCTCFCPGLKEVCMLDDVFEVMRRCQSEGRATPLHYPIYSLSDVHRLYENGTLSSGRHFMINVGTLGCRDRTRIVLPPLKKDLVISKEISSKKPWVVVKDYPGDHFITCTTIKDSNVVANVTCQVEAIHGGLIPVDHNEINLWLKQFFGKLRFLRPLSGHISFRFVVSSASGSIVPLGCKVGVSLPYICYTNVHPRIVWKPCRHFNPQCSGPIISEVGLYWMHQAVMDTIRNLSFPSITRLVGTVLDKREVLFVYWDPLPYVAYYHIQLPITNVLRLLRGNYGINNGGHGFRRAVSQSAY